MNSKVFLYGFLLGLAMFALGVFQGRTTPGPSIGVFMVGGAVLGLFYRNGGLAKPPARPPGAESAPWEAEDKRD